MKEFSPHNSHQQETRVANEELDSFRLISRPHSLKLLKQTEKERQIILQCTILPGTLSGVIGPVRIWPTTYLVDRENNHRSQLIDAWNIALYPDWHSVPDRKKIHRITLIFSALHNDCKQFDLVEDIPEKGAFVVKNIIRNKLGVYEVQI
ncbi:hypothetical protein [Prolixibacter sp. NT017]|uniref:hypothetical protein n=1 Tax=Prolixibacter sp. NT017 TaxID=2652390 RepID=UPI001284E7D6|nr:hypothetical protein [Prolixibacter sp. NT017]GET25405.1 hypothetical protein NT017_17340 [Prolixibacter sp. NT017]